MSKIEQLIKRLCPNGVEYKLLNEIFRQFSGMTGVSNKWKETGNCKFIDYMNAYKNLKIDVNRLENATVKKIEQNKLKKGDILLTSASETPDECALSSVIEDNIADNVFMDDHLFGIRIKDEYKEYINTTYINYYMHTNSFRKDVFKAVRGVTRFYISVDTFMNIKVAVPPLEVQDEIVHILDDFTLLSAELSAELKARQKQYEYYRNTLLKSSNNIKNLKFGDVAKIQRGASPRPISQFITDDENGVNWIKIGDVEEGKKYITHCKEKITIEGSKKSRFVKKGDFILSNSMSFGRPYILAIDGCIHDGWLSISNFQKYYLADFLYHLINSKDIQNMFRQKASFGGAVQNLNADIVRNIELPLIPLEEQQKIVNVLDKFEIYCNDISEGLPAEIEARKKQYEYYRDKLLTFEEKKDE